MKYELSDSNWRSRHPIVAVAYASYKIFVRLFIIVHDGGHFRTIISLASYDKMIDPNIFKYKLVCIAIKN